MPEILYTSEEASVGSNFMSYHETNVCLSIDRDYPPQLRKLFTQDTLFIRYLPREISYAGGDPNYNEVEVIGRWEPYQVFGGTSAEEITLNLEFYAEVNVIEEVKRKVDWLRSFKYPVLLNGVMYKPPRLLFRWGELINTFCILKEASPTYKQPYYVNNSGEFSLLPMAAEVSVSLVKVSDVPISGPDIMRGFR